MDRRDFFGVIAAPLLRRVGPAPVPMAKGGWATGGLIKPGGFMLPGHACCILSPLQIEQLRSAVPRIQPGDPTKGTVHIHVRLSH